MSTNKTTPNFYRLYTTLFGGQADRVPLMELGIDPEVMAAFIGRPIESVKDQVDFYSSAGYDYIRLAPSIEMIPAGAEPKEGIRTTGASDYDKARNWSAEGAGIITSVNDFEAYQWPEICDRHFVHFEEAQRYLPQGIKIVGQYGDIFTWTWEIMGFETFSIALVENPELVRLMHEKIGSIVYGLFDRMVTFDNIGALFYSDDIAYYSGLLCAPRVFREHLFPWMRKIADLCKAHNIPFIYHTDGRIWEVMDDLIELGVNALQPIEPKALDIREVKRRYGDRLCLIGNVDVDILSRGTPAQIRDIVRDLICDVGVGGGYCVGSGNTVPNYVPVENFRAMVDTTLKFGRYE